MACRIEYKASVLKDLKRLDRREAQRVLDSLEVALGGDPGRGKPLHGQFKGLFKYAIGSYRVIYARTKEGVLVLRIGHRGSVYRKG